MNRSIRSYDDLYRDRTWAYGDKPDTEFIKALIGSPRGKALDVGGGQGRHSLALSALGYDVTMIDTSAEGLHQAATVAEERSLPLHVVQSDLHHFEADHEYQVIVAALFFHQIAPRTALQLAKRLGTMLASDGFLYLSLPRFNKETELFANDLIDEAACRKEWIVKHLVTKKDRPKLGVPRRNETLAFGKALKRR